MRIKNFPSVESIDGSQDALVIEQTDGDVDKSRKVSPAQLKQYVQTGDFEATGEVKDGHGNILKNMAPNAIIGDLSQTGLTGDSVAEQLGDASEKITQLNDEIGALIETQEFSGTLASIAGNTDATVSIPITIPSGYKILGIAAAVAGSRNIAITGTLISANAVSTYVYNLFNVALSNIKVYVVVEFIKI